MFFQKTYQKTGDTMRLFLFFIAATLIAGANMQLYPKRSCALYNNLKHTYNRDNLQLDMYQSYEMLKHHKGQYLLKVPGATPSQRWVDDDCLSLRPLQGTPLYSKQNSNKKVTKTAEPQSKLLHQKAVSKSNLLALSWQNAFCETHRYRKECKRSQHLFGTQSNFTLHGLWPQPKNRVYCGVDRRFVVADRHKQWHKLPEPKLSSKTRTALAEVMPGVSGNLHRHEWIKHGTCYGTDAQHYFQDAVSLAKTVRQSAVADFFRKNEGKRIGIERVRTLFDRTFGSGSGKRVEMRCKGGLITELWLHLGSDGSNLSKALLAGTPVHSRCRYGIVDKAGYGR